jgi:hypothetical protein
MEKQRSIAKLSDFFTIFKSQKLAEAKLSRGVYMV